MTAIFPRPEGQAKLSATAQARVAICGIAPLADRGKPLCIASMNPLTCADAERWLDGIGAPA